MSRAAHVSSSYSCTGCCPSNFSGAYLTTDSVLLLIDGFASVGAVEVDADCYGNNFSFPVPASWSSDEASIASVVADDAGGGQVTGLAPGQTIVRAIWPTESYSFDGQDCRDNGIMNVSAAADAVVKPFITFGSISFSPTTIRVGTNSTSTLTVVVSASGGFPSNNGTGTLRAGIINASGAVDIDISPATQPIQLMAGQSKTYEFRYTARSQPASPVTLQARVILENLPPEIEGPGVGTSSNMLTVTP